MDPTLFPDQPKPEEHVKKHSDRKEEEYDALSRSVTNLGSRLRVLEEHYSILRNKAQLTDQNLLDFEKELRTEIRAVSEDILEIKRGMNNIREKMTLVNAELDRTVKQHEFKVVEKYLDLWNPGQFVTKDMLRKVLKRENPEEEENSETSQ